MLKIYGDKYCLKLTSTLSTLSCVSKDEFCRISAVCFKMLDMVSSSASVKPSAADVGVEMLTVLLRRLFTPFIVGCLTKSVICKQKKTFSPGMSCV